jgi:hypothetical protein
MMLCVVNCCLCQVVFIYFSFPLGYAMSVWEDPWYICPVIEVFHNERAALPMSVNGVRISRECVFIFSFQVNKLPVAALLVDLNPIVSPFEYFILVRVINYIPCVGSFAIF